MGRWSIAKSQRISRKYIFEFKFFQKIYLHIGSGNAYIQNIKLRYVYLWFV
jgi:hypothetical protein